MRYSTLRTLFPIPVVLVLLLCASQPAPAQTAGPWTAGGTLMLARTVTSAGATDAQSSNARMQATVGQPVIRITASASTTLSQGFWYSRPAAATGTDAPIEGAQPIAFELGAFPNPFAATTLIAFSLSQPARIDLDVYDMQGRLVRHIGSDVEESGQHSAAWDGRDDAGRLLPSGCYIYRLNASPSQGGSPAAEQTQDRRITLVR